MTAHRERAVEAILQGYPSIARFEITPHDDLTTTIRGFDTSSRHVRSWTVFRNGLVAEGEEP